MTFVIYDTETTGTNTAFDQILQFGAIKTDCELNELDRFKIRCRLLPYVVPAPGAMHQLHLGNRPKRDACSWRPKACPL
jgi:exodeoxyribonuclease-1